MASDRSNISLKESDYEIPQIPFKLAYSDAEKKMGNHAIVRAMVQAISGMVVDPEDFEEMYDNLHLCHGSWPSLERDGYTRTLQMADEDGGNIELGKKSIRHYGGIQNRAMRIASDLMETGVSWVVKDYSEFSMRAVQDAQIEKNVTMISRSYVQPLMRKLTRDINARLGISNDIDVSEEGLLQERDSMLRQQLDEAVHPDIKRALNSDKTPTKGVVRRVTEIALELCKFEEEMFKATTSMVANAKMFQRVKYTNNKVSVHFMDEMHTVYRLRDGCNLVNKGILVKNSRWLTPAELVATGFQVLKNKTWKDLENMLTEIPDHIYGQKMAEHQQLLSSGAGNDPRFRVTVPLPNVNHEDQSFTMGELGNQHGNMIGVDFINTLNHNWVEEKRGFRVDFMTWLWSDMGQIVDRKDRNGNIQSLVRSRHYNLNKLDGDIKSRPAPIPATYECENWGDEMIIGFGKVRNQHEIPGFFEDPNLSAYGCIVNSEGGRIKNRSNVSSTKIHALRRDVLHEIYNDNFERDLGSVLAMDRSVTKDYAHGLKGFLQFLYDERTIMHNKSAQGRRFDYSDMQVLNLSRTGPNPMIREGIDFYEGKMDEMMRSGTPGAGAGYVSGRRLDAEVTNFEKENHRMFYFWRLVRKNLINAVKRGALHTFRDMDDFMRSHLTDEHYHHLVNNADEIIGSYIILEIADSREDRENLRSLKDITANLAATGNDVETLTKSIKASNMNEAEEVAAEYADRVRKDKERDQKAANDQFNKQIESQQKLEAARLADKKEDRQLKSETSKFGAIANSLQMKQGLDVNSDGIADHRERAQDQDKTKILIHKMSLDDKEKDREVKREEIKSKEKSDARKK